MPEGAIGVADEEASPLRMGTSPGPAPTSEGRVNMLQAALSRRYEGAEAFCQFTALDGNGQ